MTTSSNVIEKYRYERRYCFTHKKGVYIININALTGLIKAIIYDIQLQHRTRLHPSLHHQDRHLNQQQFLHDRYPI